jgi:carboxyl-terminal processing protease
LAAYRIFCIALVCSALGTGQTPSGSLITVGQKPGEHRLTVEQKRLNVQSFEFIWSTIRDQYWDPGFGGVNWIGVHDELRPELERAVTMQQAREVMGRMMGRLGKSHFAIIPADVYGDVDTGSGEARGSGTAGLDVRVLDEHALVTTIEDGSPAAAQGVRAGWEILGIDGAELAPLLRRLSTLYRDSTARELYLARAVTAKLAGDPGSTVQVQFLDGADARVTKRIERVQTQGALARFGYLPPMHVWIKSRKLAGNIEYVAFNLFLDPARLMPAFGDAVQACADCAGFIIDLRGNPGGLGIMAMGMAGWFIEKPDQRLGTMHTRQAPLKFTVNPRPPTYRGPLAILVDGSSGSTSEVLAGGMKDLGRARIFGTRTAGAALPSAIDRLPNGDAFQHALADYISEGGQPLEGVGVAPDVEVRLTRAVLLAGRDPVLDAAIEWIHSRK